VRLTYADIARHAGVSTATVSRALAGKNGVSAEVAERVRMSAQALGYRGNNAARALRRRQADAIGLVISDVENPFFATIARAVQRVAARHGHAMLLCNTDESAGNERLYLHMMLGESVAGVITVPSLEDPAPFLELRDAGIPAVIADRVVRGDLLDSVLVDHRAGAREAVGHLLSHGHEHVGVIMINTAETGGRERMLGCTDAVEARPGARMTVLEEPTVKAGGVAHTWELGERLARDLVDRPDPPTAIFCANNLLCLGALRGLRGCGVRVPEDVALAGFDDEPFFDLIDPPLTVAAQPVEEIGRMAAELLYERIADPGRVARTVVVPAELRVRVSCGCSAKGGVNRPHRGP
jgi:DNA-binding LacI/PurR family transcriptional regulator